MAERMATDGTTVCELESETGSGGTGDGGGSGETGGSLRLRGWNEVGKVKAGLRQEVELGNVNKGPLPSSRALSSFAERR